MPFTLVRQDITKMQTDAIVNAANTALQMGGGVCGAIFNAAGAQPLQAACDRLAPIQTGEAVMTPGFGLPARYVIHAAGPVYHDHPPRESERLLRMAYANALRLAAEHQLNSIAFPLISSGIYGYPKDKALEAATSEIRAFLDSHEMDIYLAVFDRESFSAGKELFGRIDSYIDQHYADLHLIARSQRPIEEMPKAVREKSLFRRHPPADLSVEKMPYTLPEESVFEAPMPHLAGAPDMLNSLVTNLDEPFSATLLRLIDLKGRTDVEVYKRANMDRKLFSKIRTGQGYTPGKRSVIALAIALELSLSETEDLLKQAGYALSHSQMFDVIIEFFIQNKHYDIFDINEALFHYDLPLLGG